MDELGPDLIGSVANLDKNPPPVYIGYLSKKLSGAFDGAPDCYLTTAVKDG